MAGVTVTSAFGMKAGVTRYEITWVSDAAGTVSGSIFQMKQGTIIAVEFIPGSGALQPTDLYDVDFVDEEGVSMFDDGAGTTIGANLSNAVSAHKAPLVGLTGVTIYRRWHHGGAGELRVTNAGDSNAGTVNVYVVDGVL